jgi:hypothetical protein
LRNYAERLVGVLRVLVRVFDEDLNKSRHLRTLWRTNVQRRALRLFDKVCKVEKGQE